MTIILDGTTGITTPEIVSTGGPIVVDASAPDNSVVVDDTGNVGIGTAAPDSNLTVGSTAAPGDIVISIKGDETSRGFLMFGDPGGAQLGDIMYDHENNYMRFRINNSERVRIDSIGSMLVGTTTTGGAGGLTIIPNGSGGAGTTSPTIISNRNNTTNTSVVLIFRNAGTAVGSISHTNTATAYNTSSDYRLKEDVQPMTDALDKLAELRPVTYTWKADGSAGQGFIAHELQAVFPECVSGEKDAVDENGNPEHQGVDTSFLVATLVAAIQELTARVATLEAAQ